MDKDSLLKKRAAAETRFNELQRQRADTDAELVKLQGEYRAYTELINEIEKDSTSPEEGEVVDPNTITAELAEEK